MATAGAIQAKGGSFLIEEGADIFTPEDFTPEHHAIARTTAEFWAKDVEPNLEAIRSLTPGAALSVLRKAGELGLTAISIPERYGGMELDLVSALVVAEQLGRDGSYSGWHGAHTGIGTLPILLFGTEEQKRKYLPRLATVDLLAAYALTEPHAGSDALAARTRADLNAEGTRYILNGQKMWITNGGAADVFIVFAKIAGEQFSAFIVERAFGGVTSGAEEKKMGINGSSTTAVYFDNVPVPKENLLGEIGRGHIIAFNILNLGRLKLGPFCVGAAKHVLATSVKYAKQRQAFGKSIAAFGAIQQKLAEMAIRLYAAESVIYRTAGLIESQLEGFSWDAPDAAQRMLKAVEEFAPECSIVKIHASEMLDYAVDEAVQIHGGYGYHQDYAVERAYRDSRINRIFEGTNEINRLLTTGMLLKRAARGQLALVAAAQKALGEALNPPAGASGSDDTLVASAKKIGLLAMGAAYQKHLAALEQEQEILSAIADMIIEIYAMESALMRARKMKEGGIASDMTAVLLRDALARVELAARAVLPSCAEGDTLRAQIALLRRFAKHDPIDSIAARRRIAARLIETERYVV
jgi:alkylation response protein AidB-like acyl-CoA dehydrogenase